ncbi:hypothetical protein ACFQ1S_16625 [Kibdelosporangium lantanae]|uniref:Uncharacterized protein n=1 Tax=Kibdelosporangium lantanae TaxID=1497396 RepID=A0ABW3M8I9_9PSEU
MTAYSPRKERHGRQQHGRRPRRPKRSSQQRRGTADLPDGDVLGIGVFAFLLAWPGRMPVVANRPM